MPLMGGSRAEAARLAGMDRQALRDAVARYNAEGVVGLYNRPLPRRQEWRASACPSVRNRCVQRMAVLSLIPKRAAAARADEPPDGSGSFRASLIETAG